MDATNDFGIICDTAATGGSLTLNGLTLSRGKMTASIGDSFQYGGGIYIKIAELTLIDSASATPQGGGIYAHALLALTGSPRYCGYFQEDHGLPTI